MGGLAPLLGACFRPEFKRDGQSAGEQKVAEQNEKEAPRYIYMVGLGLRLGHSAVESLGGGEGEDLPHHR